MGILMKCAYNYQKLMTYEYRFTLGRKGKLTEITLRFSDTDFHHLAGRITYDTITKSQSLPKIQSRLDSLPYLESLLGGNQIVFQFNKKIYPYSDIESEFLLKMGDGTILNITFLFLDQSAHDIYFCRSFFPMEKTDYTQRQTQYTLLKKENYPSLLLPIQLPIKKLLLKGNIT